MKTRNIPSLNGIRAASICIVIFVHAMYRTISPKGFPGGQLGVNIFFIVSGFLITLLLIQEESANAEINLKSFFMRRIFRIFPAYYVFLLIYVILQLIGVFSFPTHSWLTAFFYLNDFKFANGDSIWETGHLWSLAVEEHFYLFWPLVFKFLKPYRVKIAVALVIIIPIIRGVQSVDQSDTTTTFFERADALMWGCLLAIYYTPISYWLKRIIYNHWFTRLIPVAGLLLSMLAMKLINTDNYFINGLIRALARGVGTFTDIFICSLIVMAINLKGSLTYKVLNSGIMNFVGKISYSLYLWQQLCFSDIQSPLFRFPYNIPLIFIFALASYYFVEKPFLKLKKAFEVNRISTKNEMHKQVLQGYRKKKRQRLGAMFLHRL